MGIFVNLKGIQETWRIFVNVIADAFNVLGGLFSQFVAAKKYELQFNSQSIYLSHYLNDQFDASLRRIYIVNDLGLLDTFIFRISETIAADEQEYIFRNSETISNNEQVYLYRLISVTGGTSFLVIIPLALSSLATDPKFIASINKYSFPDKIYEIVTI